MTATRGGLVIAGLVVPVEGMRIDNFIDTPSLKLGPRDCHPRRGTKWVRQFVFHTTKGDDPQTFVDGVGPPLAAEHVVKFWQEDPEYSGAHLVGDGDSALCCADLLHDACNHATTCNEWSVGFELYQEAGGVIRKATIAGGVRIAAAACEALNIPAQVVSDTYVPGAIIERLKDGGPDFVGVYGHRDQAWKFDYQLTPAQRAKYPHGYASRGRGDPGDHVYDELARAGFERVNCARGEDRALWSRRQGALTRLGEVGLRRLDGTFDGIAGPSTMTALHRRGFRSGRDLDIAIGAGV